MNFPDPHPLKRRAFLKLAGGVTAAMAGGAMHLHADAPARANEAEENSALPPEITANGELLHVAMFEADFSPLSAERAKTLVARDLEGETFPQPITISGSRARVAMTHDPVQLGLRLKVPGFGEVFCYADNDGKGYSSRRQINYVMDAANTRLRRVRELAVVAQKLGVPADPAVERRLEAASHPLPNMPSPRQVAAAYESLAHSLHAGERLTLNIARYRISRFSKPRNDFLFGCLSSDWTHGPEFQKILKQLFNLGVLGWYQWSKTAEPLDQRIDYTRLDQSLEWCLKNNVVPKGFGYVYMSPGATPLWLRDWPYEKVLAEYKRIVSQTARRYAGRLPYMEVINEAHDKANLFHFSQSQLLELTRESCRAAREGDPQVKRVINHCCLWAEYARSLSKNQDRKWSPYRYLKDCTDNGVEFEIVGLQLYYPQQDLMEIDRMLTRFTDFKRAIHVSELSCNSADGLDPASMRPRSLVPGWHGPWTETTQADWLEGIYSICYSKPEFEAVTWWNVADFPGHFWPYGGLVYRDLVPKESLGRLQQLQKSWGLSRNA